MIVRNAIDGMQDMYFLRKSGVIGRHHWRSWTGVMVPFMQISLTRKVFDRGVTIGTIDTEFASFMQSALAGQPLADPGPKP